MVGPARKREAVKHVQGRLETSERRACASLGQPRSTQRYRGRRPEADAELIGAMRRIARRETRAGYRGVARYLGREGWKVNIKRIHRLWKQEGLRVPAKTRKKRRLGNSSNGAQHLRAERINHVWSYDFVWDQTDGGRRLKWLPILDEYSRECLALEVDYSIRACTVIDILERLVQERGAPEFIRSDNGPEFIAQAVKVWIAKKGMKTLYIEPGSPWENPYSESFNSRFRDEFLNVEVFSSKLEAKVLGREHHKKYNHHRPHSSLGDLTPAEFAARCLAPLRSFDSVESPCAPQDSVINPKYQPILS
jgi:transposase InsO family protein